MIYQFEHEEVTVEDIREVMTVLNAIRYSREEIARKVLPAWTQPYRAIDKAVILSLESLERGLVAISKTETTSVRTLSCWYCSRELPAYDTPYNYCPNCGRRLEG